MPRDKGQKITLREVWIMRKRFEIQLETLNNEIIEMGAL
jgi:hypothetical protein